MSAPIRTRPRVNTAAGRRSATPVTRCQRDSAVMSASFSFLRTSTRSPSATSNAGRRVSEASATATTDKIMPSAIDRNTITGHEEHRGQRHDDGQRGEEHGFAGRRHGVLDRRERVLAFDAFFAVAADDEQAVVDPDREADHHREVHRPHRHRHEPADHVQEREAHRDTGEREQQRNTRGDQHAERDEQQDQRGQTAHELGFVQRFGIDLVEVTPHRPFAGDLGACAGREHQLADVGTELARRDRTLRVLVHDLVDGNERGATVGRDETGGGRERQRVDNRSRTGRALQLRDERRRAAPDRT